MGLSSAGEVGAAIRTVFPVWWITARRRFRRDSGSYLFALVFGGGLAVGAADAPRGGEPLYLSLHLLLGLGALIIAPLVLHVESVLSSRRVDLIPIPAFARWSLRILFSNPLRGSIALILVLWSIPVALRFNTAAPAAAADVVRSGAWILAALSLSILLEDVVRHRRSVILHQAVFLAALAVWPIIAAYLREDANFVPPPAWASGPAAGVILFNQPDLGSAFVGTLLPLGIGAALIQADRWFLTRYAARAAPPASSVAWTAASARWIAFPFRASVPLAKELLVPLRFLFLRMCLIFVAVSAGAAFLTGVPLLMLSFVFWWQPLSTNVIGPDVGGGERRYRLIAWPTTTVLRLRLAVQVVLTTLLVAAVAGALALVGWVQMPTIGPPSPVTYLFAFVYSVSLLPFWAVLADRFSIRYPDGMEIGTLMPERTRSGGAGAVVLLMLMWLAAAIAALLVLGVATLVIRALLPGASTTETIALVVVTTAIAHFVVYLLHTLRYDPDAVR